MYSWYGGVTFDYSDSYSNAAANYSPPSLKGVGSFETDCMFYAVDPADQYFLYLSGQTPSLIAAGAHDGAPMGALPAAPAPELPCGQWGYLPADINKDCYVNLLDFQIIIEQWLSSTALE